MKNIFLREISDWFIVNKLPSKRGKIEKAISDIEEGKPLDANYKQLFSFMCFSYSMNHGPTSFLGVERVVREIGVEAEFYYYAEDWIDHSKIKGSMKEKVVPFGETHPVIVLSSTNTMIIVRGTDNNEGYVILGHGLNNIPSKGDAGKIVFEKGGPKGGYWQYYPTT